MAVSHDFPASAARSLVEGYCQDFVSLSASLAQTIEQMRVRNLPFDACREVLERTQRGMRAMADAIDEALLGGPPPHSGTSRDATVGSASPPPAPPTARSTAAPAMSSIAAASPPVAPPVAPVPVAPAPAAAAADRPVVRPNRDPAQHGLSGTSETMPLLSVFQFLNRTRKSGTLHVDADGELLTFEFVGGIIEFTTSERPEPGERLGEILGAMFPILRESVGAFVAENERLLGARRLGNAMIKKGLATNGQVMEALERQVLMRFRRATKARLATYRFEEGERVPGDGRIRIRPFELAHGARHVPDQRR